MNLNLVNVEVFKIDDVENSIRWLVEVSFTYSDRSIHKFV